MTRIYLAGPMTNVPDYNAVTFSAAAILAREHGWTPVNPHDTDPAHDGPCPPGEKHNGHPNLCWYAAALRVLATCDAILMLPGWEASRGARLEHDWAQLAGMAIHHITEAAR